MSLIRRLGLLFIALAVMTAPASPAFAQPDLLRVRVNGETVGTPGSAGVLPGPTLLPGRAQRVRVWVRNASSHPANLFLRVVDVSSKENGCATLEVAAGDRSCRAAQGEGAATLELAAAGSRARRLDRYGTVRLTARPLRPGASRPYPLTLSVPAAAGNAVQGDTVSFALEWTLTAASRRRRSLSVPGTALTGTSVETAGPASMPSGLLADGPTPAQAPEAGDATPSLLRQAPNSAPRPGTALGRAVATTAHAADGTVEAAGRSPRREVSAAVALAGLVLVVWARRRLPA